jgi:hypothetical protein
MPSPTRPGLHAVLAACGGFLAAVLWMDLMFDVQALRTSASLPEGVVASIAGYYRRVTIDADPMRRLIGAVMLVLLGGAAWSAVRRGTPAFARVAAAVGIAPVALAVGRVFPNAMRLGDRVGTLAEQSDLARGIAHDHVACFVAMAAFVVCQVLAVRRSGRE